MPWKRFNPPGWFYGLAAKGNRELPFPLPGNFCIRRDIIACQWTALPKHCRNFRQRTEMFHLLNIFNTSACILSHAWAPENKKFFYTCIPDMDIIIQFLQFAPWNLRILASIVLSLPLFNLLEFASRIPKALKALTRFLTLDDCIRDTYVLLECWNTQMCDERFPRKIRHGNFPKISSWWNCLLRGGKEEQMWYERSFVLVPKVEPTWPHDYLLIDPRQKQFYFLTIHNTHFCIAAYPPSHDWLECIFWISMTKHLYPDAIFKNSEASRRESWEDQPEAVSTKERYSSDDAWIMEIVKRISERQEDGESLGRKDKLVYLL